MRHLLQSLIISFAVIAIASPSFAGDDHKGNNWDRDNKEQSYHSKKDKNHHAKKEKQLHAKLNILINALVVCPPDSPKRFVDNGDGTICDRQTGLMWEMKDASDGSQDHSNPRDVDNTYTWTSTADGDLTNPAGPAFTDFLARLNGEIWTFGAPGQLGGHSDWRLPTIAELQTILDCSNSPCIDPVFGPTAATNYWSSTSNTAIKSTAWGVGFSVGNVGDFFKTNAPSVRAVRGGR